MDLVTRNALAVKYEPLVRVIADGLCRRVPRHWDAEDLYGYGMLALIAALDAYRSERNRGGDLRTYLRCAVRYGILDSLRTVDHNRRRTLAPARTVQMEVEVAGAPNQERHAVRNEIWRAAARLPERWQRVLRLYYDEDKTMAECGRALGVNESRVSQMHASAVRRLREAFRT